MTAASCDGDQTLPMLNTIVLYWRGPSDIETLLETLIVCSTDHMT
jgi:hypothetical protein